ncbi:MAG: HAD family hydrolase [Chloroflexi bacterium]|nr:MAG: HAD family hydrolase [Chloroflexota bacterium]
MPLDLNRIQALCFDVDGTLNDTDDQFAEQAERLLQPLRFLLPGRDARRAARRLVMWAEAPGNALVGLPDWLGIDDEMARLVNFINRRRKRRFKTFRPIPGVVEMLERLHTKYPLSVVSARDVESTTEFLRHSGLDKYFICVAGALTAKHTKPYPDPIYWAAERMGVKAENCLMIGDTTVDIRAGKAAGAQTVGVLCGFGEENELRRKGADEILKMTPELAGLLGR